MKEEIKEILKRYWGYDEFRPLQEEIIRSVMEGQDTLALMPTGGGKSITYQVPALTMEGVCLVITPLIALMKDQVEDLRRCGISAEAIYTGMEQGMIQSVINKTIGGGVKFLYLSPERLSSENFRIKLKQMKVSMLAVDEAHCISQWGYDFRPSYLRISEIRTFFPNAPVLALTATATVRVVDDIQDKLNFPKQHVLSKSFRRTNLAYVVRQTDDKQGEMLHILSSVNACAIVYVRKRDTTKQLADFLCLNGIKADYYHAGLSAIQREMKQNDWKNDVTSVIVATNAFGMGINKPDVRVVIHYDMPETIEAYFQEAGRAGRDEKKAFAVLLANKAGIAALKTRVTKSFPEKSYIKKVYESLGNYFQIAEGAGKGYPFEFDADTFIHDFKLDRIKTFSALKILEMSGYLECTDDINVHSRICFSVDRLSLNKFDSPDELTENLLELLMRSYAGIFSQYIYINEQYLADKLLVARSEIYECLTELAKRKVVSYIPGNDSLYIIYREPRLPLSYISISGEAYGDRKKMYESGINEVIRYVEDAGRCRQLFLVNYFGQRERERCGVCDICLKRKKESVRSIREIDNLLIALLSKEDIHIKTLSRMFEDPEREVVIESLRNMLDNGVVYYKQPFVLSLKKSEK
ncbi:RecQ family ATP-dependent DNA helicase [Odoribacter sp. OttesenSCG-928-G04]|nr:RecQ family ATP-dependent DNA helicase [Odoribacter sp. OttesenSCG-928-G04]